MLWAFGGFAGAFAAMKRQSECGSKDRWIARPIATSTAPLPLDFHRVESRKRGNVIGRI